MKFTKQAFRAALKSNNQTEVWHLASVKFGRSPSRKEVDALIEEVANTVRDARKARTMAYDSQRKLRIRFAMAQAWDRRGAYAQYGDSYYRQKALEMLRRLLTEDSWHYTKVAMMGHTHLYFCSPEYGHSDYNKVCTCKIDSNESFVKKVIELSHRIYVKKTFPGVRDLESN